MQTIKVCEYLNTTHLLSPDKGKVLRDVILKKLANLDKVTIDFEGYEYLSSSFLNEAIGNIIIEQKLSSKNFKERILWKNLSKDDEIDLLLAIENAETRLELVKKKIDPDEFYRSTLPAV